VVAIGNPALRRRWQQVLKASGAPLGVVVHPRAYVGPPEEGQISCAAVDLSRYWR
jgi:hypothetical protein